MNIAFDAAPSATDPIHAILNTQGDSVLAVIAGVEGPSYRPLGAMMAIIPDQTRVGTLSSGCIESDIALHAADTLKTGTPRLIRYGLGSPFVDIELPCGGGLDILLVPKPDRTALQTIADRQSTRHGCSLHIDMNSGAMTVQDSGATERNDNALTVRFDPTLRFLVFGKGPEAGTLAALAKSVGYPVLLLSPDTETLQAGERAGCPVQHLTSKHFPDDLAADPHTAIVLFFHDHDWEPPILQDALKTDAFYIGSQGSQRARNARVVTLKEMGITPANLQRLRGPVGLIPSARDAGTLAVSVLAEVLATAM